MSAAEILLLAQVLRNPNTAGGYDQPEPVEVHVYPKTAGLSVGAILIIAALVILPIAIPVMTGGKW